MTTKLAIGAALLGAVILGATLSGFGIAQQSSAPAKSTLFSEAQEEDIRDLVHDFLMDNPEVLIESLNAYQNRERAMAEARLEVGARNNLTALIEGEGGYTVGADAANAKVAVIEFFDYHCGYCKRATGLVQDLTKDDPDVKVVFRELPILREESKMAAEYALAARAQGKYAELHFALMTAQGTLTKDRVKSIAKKAGVNIKELEASLSDPLIEASIKETKKFAQEMGADGTPTFIVATLDGKFIEVMPGYSAENLLEAIDAAKKAAG